MLPKARLVPEHDVAVYHHLMRGFIKLLKEPENAGKLALVELPGHIRRNSVYDAGVFRGRPCILVFLEKHRCGRRAFIPKVVNVKSRNHLSYSMEDKVDNALALDLFSGPP